MYKALTLITLAFATTQAVELESAIENEQPVLAETTVQANAHAGAKTLSESMAGLQHVYDNLKDMTSEAEKILAQAKDFTTSQDAAFVQEMQDLIDGYNSGNSNGEAVI